MSMIQYSVWNECNGSCDFCLRKERKHYNKEEMLFALEAVMHNIKLQDFTKEYSDGVSLLGGELYYITDKDIQDKFMELVDVIIDCVLLKSTNPNRRYSSVTNGNYDPAFLFRVVDHLEKRVGTQFVDINFSYDIKYRYKDEATPLRVINNINAFHERYNYRVGVQMILAQYLIDAINKGEWSIDGLLKQIPGNMLCFLYPHPINSNKIVYDFYLKRNDFLNFLIELKQNYPDIYNSFVFSTRNSSRFKVTGLVDKSYIETGKLSDEKPSLSDGKEVINKLCGHSMLYRSYIDSSACVLCDIEALEGSSEAL